MSLLGIMQLSNFGMDLYEIFVRQGRKKTVLPQKITNSVREKDITFNYYTKRK